MKILIIQFRFASKGNADSTYDPDSTKKVNNYLFPLGLAYISSYLKRAGKDVTVLNLNAREGTVHSILADETAKADYDIAFIGGLSMFYPHIESTIKCLKEVSPTTKIVVGGGIVTAQPEIMFDLLKFDFGIIGEGEETALDLINCLEQRGSLFLVKGIIYKNFHCEIVITYPRETIKDLDSLPYPDFEAFGLVEHLDANTLPGIGWAYDIVDTPRPYPILGSRSCTHGCTFCFHPLGQKYRQRSVDNIMDELKQNVEKYDINIINMYDELFSANKERVLEFCTKIKAYSDSIGRTLYWSCNCRVDTTTEEMLIAMKKSGVYMLSFGLESASQNVLDSMKKHTTPAQIEAVIRLLRKHQIGLVGGFIFGDPAETSETAQETIAFIQRNRRLLGSGVSFVFIIPFQGSPVYKYCVDKHIIPDEVKLIKDRATDWFDYLDPLNMTHMPTEEFERLKRDVFSLQTMPAAHTITTLDEDATSVMCPECGWETVYETIPQPLGFETRIVGCRHCNYRFHIVSKWYPLKEIMINVIGIKYLNLLRGKT